MLSAAFFFLATCLVISIHKQKESAPWVAAIAGVCFGIAVLIKQNYLFTLPGFFILLIFSKNHLYTKTIFTSGLIFSSGLSFVILICFLPYLLLDGGMDALVGGIEAIWNFPKLHQPLFPLMEFLDLSTLSKSTFLLISLLALASLISIKPIYISNEASRQSLSILLFIIISLVGLKISAIETHYFPHYYGMYTPFIALSVFTIYGVMTSTGKNSVENWHPFCRIIIFIVALSFALMMMIHRSEYNLNINQRNIDPNLILFLTSLGSNSISWYVVDLSPYHTVLNQQRIGDGHPAMLRYISDGIRFNSISNLSLYSERVAQNPCLALIDSGKELIIFKSDNEEYVDRFVPNCLTKKNSGYRELCSNDIDNIKDKNVEFRIISGYRIFIKK